VKTSELIDLLAHGSGAEDGHAVTRRIAAALGVGAAGAFALMLVCFDLNPALGSLLGDPAFWSKTSFSALLVGGGALATARLSRPGVPVGHAALILVVPVLALWLLMSMSIAQADPGTRMGLVLGRTWRSCSLNIALLSLPTFLASAWALRGLAPTSLRLAGGAAGLLSGALGALIYGLHCPELATPFLGVWYVIGIASPAAAGAWLGPRFLRW
jgi:hypothetical protein